MKKKKMGAAEFTFQCILYVLFGIFTLSCIYPFYYLFINTISSNDLSSAGYVTFIQRKFISLII
ncbi:hypothetical protein D3C76_363050 [compost metagenome]